MPEHLNKCLVEFPVLLLKIPPDTYLNLLVTTYFIKSCSNSMMYFIKALFPDELNVHLINSLIMKRVNAKKSLSKGNNSVCRE